MYYGGLTDKEYQEYKALLYECFKLCFTDVVKIKYDDKKRSNMVDLLLKELDKYDKIDPKEFDMKKEYYFYYYSMLSMKAKISMYKAHIFNEDGMFFLTTQNLYLLS